MIASHVGRPAEVHALGRQWTVGRLTRADWAAWLEWAKERIPDPLDVLSRHLDKFSPKLHDVLCRQAVELASEYLSIGSREVQRCLASLEGSTRMLWQLLKKHHTDITEDEAFEVSVEIGVEAIRELVERTSGKAPPQGNAEAGPATGSSGRESTDA